MSEHLHAPTGSQHDHNPHDHCDGGHNHTHHGHASCDQHGHDHHHDHDHACHDHAHHDHHDEHSHHQPVNFGGFHGEISSHTHEQASVVTVSLVNEATDETTLDETPAPSFTVVANALQAIALGVEEAGGIVGHIKASGQSDGETINASCTDPHEAPVIKGSADLLLRPGAAVDLAAIAMLIDLEVLEAIVVQALNESLPS